MGKQKKKPIAKSKMALKKPTVKKRVVRRGTKKTPAKKPSVRLAPSLATIPLPVTVQPSPSAMQRTKPKDTMSLRRHIISAFSLVAMSVVSLAVIAGFAQVTFMDIDSLNIPTTSLLKPVTIESRFFSSVAGELTLALPASWTVTTTDDNIITYAHVTETNANLTITVQTNETENIFTWLQAHQPDYTNALVVESDSAVTAWRGVTVTATTTDNIPLQIIYIPIQKNLGERYMVTLRAEVPTAEAELFVKQAFDTLLENFGVK